MSWSATEIRSLDQLLYEFMTDMGLHLDFSAPSHSIAVENFKTKLSAWKARQPQQRQNEG